MKIQITIEHLERIISAAKTARAKDDSLSTTLEIEATSKTDTHTGSDMVGVIIKSSYQDANGCVIFWR